MPVIHLKLRVKYFAIFKALNLSDIHVFTSQPLLQAGGASHIALVSSQGANAGAFANDWYDCVLPAASFCLSHGSKGHDVAP
mgnify:CR=1 FL=1